jgi:signal peptidase I
MATTRPIRAGRGFAFAGRLVDLALLGVIALGLTSVLFGRVLPAAGHPAFVVAGPSMVPALPVGTLVVLDAVDPSRLEVGDIVTLKSGSQQAVFTHRILRVVDREDGRWIETKGDANEHIDPSLTPVSAVLGRVGVAVPHLGYLLTLLSTLQGLVLLLGTGATLLVLGWWLDELVVDRRRRASHAVAAAAAPMMVAGPIVPPAPAVATPAAPIAMPARAIPAMRSDPEPKRTRGRQRAGGKLRPEPTAAPAEATLPSPGTISAIELLRADPAGHRRRRRSELVRGRP